MRHWHRVWASKKEWERILRRATILWTPELRERMRFRHIRHANRGSPSSRTELVLDGEVIWTFPDRYFDPTLLGGGWLASRPNAVARWGSRPGLEPQELFGMMRGYINTPPALLLEPIAGENFHLMDIMRAADRRISTVRITWWAFTGMGGGHAGLGNPARKVLAARLAKRD